MSGDDCAQDRRDLWDAVNDQRKQGTRIEVVLARIETMLTERCGLCTKTQAAHGERLDDLEGSENRRKGGLAVMLAVASAAGALAGALIKVFWK